jgi:hypothetical protein
MAETNIRLAKPWDRDQVAQMQAALWPEASPEESLSQGLAKIVLALSGVWPR